MAETTKKSVGLIIVTHDKEGRPVAVLQRRGRRNHEKDWEPESRPGGCQASVHGGLEADETYEKALYRETTEELGEDFADMFLDQQSPLEYLTLIVDENGVQTFARFIAREHLSRIRWGPSSAGADFVYLEDVPKIQNLCDFDKNEGVTDSRIIAMFPDEKKAVEIALSLFTD